MSALSSFLEPAWRRLAYHNQGGLRLATPLLLPLAGLYGWAGQIRRKMYQLGFWKTRSFPIPILSIGNLTVGGVGKTPFTLFLGHYLRRMGYRPAILLRGYGRKSSHPIILKPGGFQTNRVEEYGDEPSLLAFQTDSPIAIARNRAEGVEQILRETDCNLVLLDDGFQHLQLARDLDWVVFDGEHPWGNGHCLPLGPLREPIGALRAASAIILNGEINPYFAETLSRYDLPVFEGGLEWMGLYPLAGWMQQEGDTLLPLDNFQQQPMILASGIGSPGRLKRQDESYGLRIAEHVRYPDHHWFSDTDIRVLALKSRTHPILLTEKDAIRLFSHPALPDELLNHCYVIHAIWQMKQAEPFNRWLEKTITFIVSPRDPVAYPPFNE